MKKSLVLLIGFIVISSGCAAPTPQSVSPMGNYSGAPQSDSIASSGDTYNTPQKSNILTQPSGSAPTAMASTAPNANMMSKEMTQQDMALQRPNYNTEEYSNIIENPFIEVVKSPLSTFSIDVDTASYSNIRRYIESKQAPPKGSVRIEEMINYFTYDYPQPTGNDPFSINMEMSNAPWNKEHKLVSIGLQGKKIAKENMPISNLVFLIDTSGSMSGSIEMLKESFKLLVNQLREQDRVSIVTYAGSAGLVLDSTSGANKSKIIEAIDRLQSGGSTAGGAGINLAYKVAKDNFIKNGNNRVILATDGDFNVGVSSEAELVSMIEKKREEGTFLSVLGFGMGNYKDSKMEQLADKGNGNYAYIDSIKEAKKVFVEQMAGTVLPIAKDVKLQLEFNPTKVKSYRLIGYENRKLNNEDFNNDKKDAGEMGAGHSVTALYELTMAGSNETTTKIDDLKYQENVIKTDAFKTDELMTVKFRYKEPNEDQSKLITKTLQNNSNDFNQTSDNFRFASSVAGFGLLLRDSQYKGNINLQSIQEMAQKSKGQDIEGYRADFIKMLDIYQSIKDRPQASYNY
ncbi:MAG: VWA domain-containing protein [Candidatus Sericytochromatia bacterium]